MADLEDVLSVYDAFPMDDGDVALVTDLSVVQEVAGLADHWDPLVRRDLALLLREIGVSELLIAVARRDRVAQPGDEALWADLREELLGSAIEVGPLVVLPAA